MWRRGRVIDFRIGAPQLLLLKAALSADKAEAADALDEWWRDITDFDDVRGTDSGLFPRIYWNLGSRIRDGKLAARLKGAARHHWAKNQYLIASAGELVGRLNQAGIPVLLMKGAAIAAAIDDDPGLRAMSDCDMLVPKDRAVEVLELLARTDLLDRLHVAPRDLDLIHGVTLRRRGNRHALFDIHWRPLRAVGAEELAQEMFAGARPVQFAGHAALAPCPEHLVFHAVIHGAEWSPFPRYDWLIDVIKILRRAGAAFDWESLADVALRYRFAVLMRAALLEVAGKGGVAVPDRVLRSLGRPAISFEHRETQIRLSQPASLTAVDELLLSLQAIRRRDRDSLNRSALSALPILASSFFGTRASDRSFIHNDRKERITHLYGWSAPEQGGRWSEGHLASVAIYAPERPRPSTLRLRGFPLPARGARARVVTVSAGPYRLGRFTWSGSGIGPLVQAVRLPARIWHGDTAVVRFRVQTPISPISIGLNGDVRALGVFVQHISADPVVRDAIASPLDVSAAGADEEILWHGWSTPEPMGCWTVGSSAILCWRAASDIPAGAIFVVERSMIAPGSPELTGRCRLGGQKWQRFQCSAVQKRPQVRLGATAPIRAGDLVELELKIDAPRSPAETNGSPDERLLGLCVRRIWIEPAAAQS